MTEEYITCNQLKFKKLYGQEEIMLQLDKMAGKINQNYGAILEKNGEERIVVIGVLNGAFMFHSEIVKRLKIPVLVDFIRCRSYVGENSQQLQILSEPNWSIISGAHVLLLDDICDTGKTLNLAIQQFEKKGAKSIQTAVLVMRPDKQHKIPPTYHSLVCSDFIIGFGLDYNLQGRQYPAIYQKIKE